MQQTTINMQTHANWSKKRVQMVTTASTVAIGRNITLQWSFMVTANYLFENNRDPIQLQAFVKWDQLQSYMISIKHSLGRAFLSIV